jgi:hypothetical protein
MRLDDQYIAEVLALAERNIGPGEFSHMPIHVDAAFLRDVLTELRDRRKLGPVVLGDTVHATIALTGLERLKNQGSKIEELLDARLAVARATILAMIEKGRAA